MLYSNDDVRDLYFDIDRILKRDNTLSFKDLQKRLRKQINFQDGCEEGNLLGDALLKLADGNDNLYVKDFLLTNGCEPLQQEKAVNEEEEQSRPEVEENVAGPSNSSEVGSNNPTSSQSAIPYTKIEEILARDPNIKPEDFYKELKEEIKVDIEIFDLFADAVRSGGAGISNNRDTFLKAVELLGRSCIKINSLKNTTSSNLLDIAAVSGQADVIKILLGSGEFNEEEKIQALNLAIIQGNAQEVEAFLGYIDHAKILEVLNTVPCNESTEVMKILLNNKRFTEQQKVQALSDASIDGDPLKVRLLLKYMTGIPEAGIKNLLGIIKESKSSLEKELKIDSEFKGDPNNSDHRKYFSSIAIIKLLESSIVIPMDTCYVNPTAEPVVAPAKAQEPDADSQIIAPSNGDSRPAILESSEHTEISTKTNEEYTESQKPVEIDDFKEAKYKESKKDFYISLAKDVAGVVITGLFIATAVMIPSVAGTVVCGIVAALVAIGTLIHSVNSTVPSYKEMKDNKVELVDQARMVSCK